MDDNDNDEETNVLDYVLGMRQRLATLYECFAENSGKVLEKQKSIMINLCNHGHLNLAIKYSYCSCLVHANSRRPGKALLQ